MTRFIIICLSIFTVLTGIFYINLFIKVRENARRDLYFIEQSLIEVLDGAEESMIAVGDEINKIPEVNLKQIHKIFKKFAEKIDPLKNSLSWTMFDWVDNNGYQTVNTIFGINTKNPPFMLERIYINSNSEMRSILFAEAAIGKSSKLYVIPLGVRVSTQNVARAGTIAAGIDIEKFYKMITSKISKNTNFVVIDSRNDFVVLGSDHLEWKKKIPYDNYLYSLRMEKKYPYVIKTDYKDDNFFSDSVRKSFEITIVLAIFLVILKNFRRKKIL